ncbi:MAG: hypothetical protein ABFC24_03335 [Methanoregulaceae archaeon]
MEKTRLFVILIAAVCVLSFLPGAGAMSIQLDPLSASGSPASVNTASANDNYPISVDQAKSSVRVFMNDLALDPVLSSTGSLEVGNYYHLSVDSDTFDVNQNTGVVEFVHFGENAPTSADLNITRDQAYAAAKDYAGQKYDGFSGKTWNLVIDKIYSDYDYEYNATTGDWKRVDKKAYDFVFREEKDHVLLPNLVHVRVNAQTGAIIDYWGVDRLVTAGLKNSVSLGEATETAESYFGIGSGSDFKVSSSEGYLAVVTRYQNVENLAWVIKLKGCYSWNQDYEQTYLAVVDATDGSVIGSTWSSIWPESRLAYYLN